MVGPKEWQRPNGSFSLPLSLTGWARGAVLSPTTDRWGPPVSVPARAPARAEQAGGNGLAWGGLGRAKQAGAGSRMRPRVSVPDSGRGGGFRAEKGGLGRSGWLGLLALGLVRVRGLVSFCI